MLWRMIKSHPIAAAILFVLFGSSIYVASYLIVANSEAVDAAREYGSERNLISADARVGFTGFRIRVAGQDGEASFRLVDASSGIEVRFKLEKSAGQWEVTHANPE